MLCILHIQSVFAQWKQVPIAQSNSFFAIKGGAFFGKDSIVVYDLGSNYLSTDGGNSFSIWDERPIGDPINLQNLGNNIIRSVNSSSFIAASNTNGNSWFPIYIKNNTDTAFENNRIILGHFFDEKRAIVMGDPKNGCYEMWNTINGGENWSLIPCKDIALPNYGNSIFRSFQNLYSFNGIAIFMSNSQENKNKLIRTLDFGLSFDTIMLPTGKVLQSVAFLNADEGLAIMTDSANFSIKSYYQVSNNGQSFTLHKMLLDYPTGIIAHSKDDGKVIYLLYGLDGLIYSNSKGNEWFVLDAERHSKIFSFDDSHMASIINESGNPNRLRIFESVLLNTNKIVKHHSKIEIYPNPAFDFIQISEAISDYTIIGIDGKIVQKYDGNNDFNKISISNLNSGTYFLKIQLGENRSVHKIQIEN